MTLRSDPFGMPDAVAISFALYAPPLTASSTAAALSSLLCAGFGVAAFLADGTAGVGFAAGLRMRFALATVGPFGAGGIGSPPTATVAPLPTLSVMVAWAGILARYART